MKKMSKEPKRNVYVGHRYVPKVMGEWDKSQTYEGLSIVTNKGTSYTSKKRVPKGIDILNEEYWVVTGNYNAQIEEYRKEVRAFDERINENQSDIENTITDLALTNQKVNDLGFNLRDYGIKDGDDITDELISLLDNSSKILIPEGTYYWSKPIKTNKGVKIEGSGKDKTTLVYKPNLENDLNQAAFNIAVPSDDLDNIVEIEELTFKDESSNSSNLMRVARIFPNGDDRWAARVYFHKTDFTGYKNTGLTVIAPYEAVFSHMKFHTSEP